MKFGWIGYIFSFVCLCFLFGVLHKWCYPELIIISEELSEANGFFYRIYSVGRCGFSCTCHELPNWCGCYFNVLFGCWSIQIGELLLVSAIRA